MDEIIAALLRCPDAAGRQMVLLDAAAPCLALVQALKARSDAVLRTDPPLARRLADIAGEVATSSPAPLCAATAAWAAGNARFYGGDYTGCLALYRQAIPAFEQVGLSLEAGRLRANCVAVLTDLGRLAEALAEAALARPLLAAHGPTRFLAPLEMNAAVLHRHLDDFGEALATCDRGRAIALALGNAVMSARFDVNRALILENLDSYRAAIAALMETLPIFERHNEALELARARLNLGLLHTRVGHYRQALAELERSCQGFASLGNDMEVAVTDWHRAGVYLKLNLLPEVIEHNTAAHGIFMQHGLVRQAALADSETAVAFHRLGEPEEAERLIGQARTALAGTGPLPVQLAQLDLLESGFHLANGAAALAWACAERGLAALTDGPFPLKRASLRLALADACAALDRPGEAQTAYRAALEVVGPAGLADLTYRAQFGLGQIAEGQDDAASALVWYRQAMATATRASFGLGASEFRAAFLSDKLATHQAAVLLHLAKGDLPAAFAAAEGARANAGRFLSLAANTPEHAEPDPRAVEELAQRREEWAWLYSRLERERWSAEPAEPARGSEETVALAGLAATERRLADLLRSADPRNSASPAPAADLAAIQARLAPDEALLAYFVARDQVIGFRVTREASDAIPNLASLAEVRAHLDRLRFALRSMSADAQTQLGWFYRALMVGFCHAPGASEAPGASASQLRRLYIVPHDLLYHLPFHALHDGQSYLLERCEIVYLPAASWLRQGQTFGVSETPKASVRAVIIGCDHDGRVPAALAEAQAIHNLLAATAAQTGIAPRLLQGEDATEAALRAHLPGAGILHLATHGVFRQDNPLFSALRLTDGWLTLADIKRMDLRRTTLVTLSACETGAGDVRGGDLLGLSQAFLAAGAKVLVASLWPVPDEATRRLMVGFYRRLVAGEAVASALRGAQLELLADAAYRQPLYWAGFGVMGE